MDARARQQQVLQYVVSYRINCGREGKTNKEQISSNESTATNESTTVVYTTINNNKTMGKG